MTTLLAALLGFATAALPDLLKLYRDGQDRRHELAILDRQMELQKLGHGQRLEEINAQADIAESLALRRPLDKTGVAFIDGLNGSVRPVLTYAFFLLYALLKLAQIDALGAKAALDTPWLIWTDEDQAIFAAIISFWFGSRMMQKCRAGK